MLDKHPLYPGLELDLTRSRPASTAAVLHLGAAAAAVARLPLDLADVGEVLEVAPGGDAGGADGRRRPRSPTAALGARAAPR